MVDIECTRCGATGTGYATNYVAKFSLTHNTGCGAKIGIPKYSVTTKTTVTTTTASDTKTVVVKPKRKAKKKSAAA